MEFLNNPARFLDEYHFKVTFECIAELPDDLEWRLIFVSSPENPQLDQELDCCIVGPVPVGTNCFAFKSPAPDPSKIPKADLLGIAALIFTGIYNDQEFVRVGYYQNTTYDNEDMQNKPPEEPIVELLRREVNLKPRVTQFPIKWCVHHPSRYVAIFLTPYERNVSSITSAEVAAGPSQSAAVPSANDLGEDEPMEVQPTPVTVV